MLSDAARILLGYLLGSISGSLLLGRLRGVDIRRQGSGNAGGTNALRTQGVRFALGVIVIDLGKAALAAWAGGCGIADERHALIMALLAGAAAAAGHVWPIYFGFRGGKGVAAVLGLLLVLWPMGALIMVVTALGVIGITGYVGLGSILAGVGLVPAAALIAPEPHRWVWTAAAAAIAAFILYTHRANVQRLRAGTENRFERARVLARLVRWRT
ncbi:MAG: glycerol-3-phosphate 1-O-acyltransferase PlsY [Opitutaceae bacterium]|nr:glycerol-3-phosphate 1-O-acyltransferase PlsY [Opitutaceae bacterium]